MKESKPDTIRNIAVLSYGGAGKTTLIEAFLCSSGTIPQMAPVVARTPAMDYDPEEHHRKVSIQTSLCQISWNDTALNLLDNPGPPGPDLHQRAGQGRDRLGDAGRGDREGVGDQDGPAQPADREGGLPGRGGGPPHRRGVSVRVGWERETAEGRGAGGPERRG